MSEPSPAVLLVEDDASLRRSLAQWLSLNGFSVSQAANGRDALKLLAADPVHVVISDVRMRGMNGLELLGAIKADQPNLPVVILSGHGDVPMAVSAMQKGAYTFLTKPYVPEQLIATLHNAMEQSRLHRRIDVLEQDSEIGRRLGDRLIGADQSMVKLRAAVMQLAPLPVDVLINGETGTGKEVVARLLHDCSPRQKAPFVAINCAALPDEIIESELFGHEAGAFTGASGTRTGKFEFASGGTIFLDEIESMPLAAQAKLLRVLQERVVTRLGSNREIPIDIRVVSATKSGLAELSTRGQFREDLYYRLMAAEITIPPLRERGHDAALLFEHFMRSMTGRLGRTPESLGAQETLFILGYSWPGNIRQLKHLAERRALGLDWKPDADLASFPVSDNAPLTELVDRFEFGVIEQALKAANGKVSLAAEQLGIPRRTLNEKLKRLSGRQNRDGG